jgi:signal transduction histidine kinase
MEKLVKRQENIDINQELVKKNKELNEQVENIKKLNIIKEEKLRMEMSLENITSYNNHLANVIRGVNHEVSPWIGTISNIASVAKMEIKANTHKNNSLLEYFETISKASKQAAEVLVLTSKNIKKLRNWSNGKSNMKDTVSSWCYIAMMEHDIKGKINEHNLQIDYSTLDFDVIHSPMLVSQIILNLVKNSVDHNSHMLDDLLIKIYGNSKDTVYVEDNGKGIERQILKNIFNVGIVGVTTKNDNPLPCGLGLASIKDYCVLMGSKIKAESKMGKYTRFHVVFVPGEETITIKKTKNKTEDSSSFKRDYYEVIEQPSDTYKSKASSTTLATKCYFELPDSKQKPISDTSIEFDPHDTSSEFTQINTTLEQLKNLK